MRDAERRVFEELKNLMQEYELPYEHVNRTKHKAIQFMINGKRLLFTYSGGGFRSALNAKADLRRIIASHIGPSKGAARLIEGAAQRSQQQGAARLIEGAAQRSREQGSVRLIEGAAQRSQEQGSVRLIEGAAQRSREQGNPQLQLSAPKPTKTVSPPWANGHDRVPPEPQHASHDDPAAAEAIAPPEEAPVLAPQHASHVPPPDPEPAPPAPAESPAKPQRINTDDAFILHRARTLVPGKCLVIELERDLVVEAGSVLVVPLHRPESVIPLTRVQFDAMFEAVLEPAQAAPSPVAVAQDMSTAQQQVWSSEAADMPGAQQQQRAWGNEVADMPAQQAWWAKPSDGARTSQAVAARPSNLPAARAVSVSPVPSLTSPQLGRMLCAMAQALHATKRTDLAPATIQRFLDNADGKQLTARLPQLVSRGFAERGLPIPNYPRSSHYRITTAGNDAAKQLGNWPWEAASVPVPDWRR